MSGPCEVKVTSALDGGFMLSCDNCQATWGPHDLERAAMYAKFHERYMASMPDRTMCWSGDHEMDKPDGPPPYECAFHAVGKTEADWDRYWEEKLLPWISTISSEYKASEEQ